MDDKEKPPEPLPHYALPNFSVVLPTFANHESDVIAQAFRIGNYVSLHDLPNRVKPGQVSRGRFQKILDNRQPSDVVTPENPAGRFHNKPKYFSDFEYMPTPYSIADSIMHAERLEHNKDVEKAGHKAPFTMADTKVRLKYEDAFGFTKADFNAYNDSPDPYELADDQALRHKWLQEAQILAGPFRPAGRVKGATGEAATERPGHASMPEIVEFLRRSIEADWEDYTFIVCATDDEHVVIRFELSTLDSEPGLVAYMNIFARTDLTVNKYLLKKVVEDWNVTPGDGHLYFTFRPPWVTTKMADTFYSLHPEHRSFQDPRTAKHLHSTADDSYGGSASADALDTTVGGLRPELT